MLKAVIYTRVSTEEQAENGTSLETQELGCLRKAAQIGAQVIGIHKDEGISGAFYMSRPGMLAALADVEAGRAEILIVASLSRFSRDVEHQQGLKKRIERAGGRLVLCDMELQDTPEGDLQFGIMGQFAQYERQVIRKRTMIGRKKRAEEGIQPYRTLSPFGYHVPTEKDVLAGVYPASALGLYQVIEEEAAVVRELFIRCAAGTPLRGLAKWLDAKGVPTPQGGLRWYPSTLRCLLNNSVYKGTALVGRREVVTDESRLQKGFKMSYSLRSRPADQCVPIAVPALVTEDLWEACQKRLGDNQAAFSGNPKRRYTLSGYAVCIECGRRMGGWTCHGCSYYVCNVEWCNQYKRAKRGPDAENAVRLCIETLAAEPEQIAKAITVYTEADHDSDAGDVLKKLQGEMEALAAQEKATITAQIAGIQNGADPGIYAGLFSEIARKRKELQERISALSVPFPEETFNPKETARIIAQIAADIHLVFSSPDVSPARKNAILASILRSVKIDVDRYHVELAPIPGSGLTVQQHPS